MLTTRRLAVIVTLKCTLNCKLCCNCATLYKNPPILDKQLIFDDLKSIFEIYDRIEWLQFVGGELFLHPAMGEIIEESFKYDAQFDRIILMTNGTIVPSAETLEILKRHRDKIEVQISDYGTLSYKLTELVEVFEKMSIQHVVKKFYGDIQHYGGWVDCGDFNDRQYSAEEVRHVFESCWQIGMKNLHAYNGQLHNCIRSLFATDLGMQETPSDEYIDLRDPNTSVEDKKAIAALFNTRPLSACHLCNGFNTETSERHPAAEQVPR